jgi:GWxTD domain-containing protein
MRLPRLLISCLSLVVCGWPNSAQAQDQAKQSTDKPAAAPARETVAKPLTEKERKRKEAKLRKELEAPYRKWLNEDVVYIITDEEKSAFHKLNTAEEQEQFIEQFWLRRDPTPDTAENEFKEEHYRRIAYANDRFASGIPGWRADRGRIYITFGPPDEIESHPSGGMYERPADEGGGTTSTFPFEQWRYRWIEGVGSDIKLEFVDTTQSGEYRLTYDPSEKDALLNVPGAGLTLMEQMGLASKTDRFTRTDGTHLANSIAGPGDNGMREFQRIEQFVNLQKPPKAKFTDLEAAVTSKITFNLLPIRVRVDFMRVTNSSILANITLQIENKDLQFQAKDGVQKAVVHIYARITTMARRVVNVFEDTVTVESPPEMLQAYAAKPSMYQKPVPLPPGLYRLNVVVKDTVGGNMNNYEMALNVPHFDDEKLASSSLVLADILEKVPTRSIGTGPFVVGASKVRPRMSETFRHDEKMGIYLQLYNFGPDEKTQKPNGVIEYEVVKNGTNEKIF